MKLLRVNDIVQYISNSGQHCTARVLKVYDNEFLASTYEIKGKRLEPEEQNWHSFDRWRPNGFRITTAAPHRLIEVMKKSIYG